MVPKGWSLVEAKEICNSISVGVVIKPSQYYVEEREGVKAFRSANVREGFINDSNWVYFSEEEHKANKKSQLKTGDVLIVRTGYPGTACVVTPEFEGANAIDIVIARPNTTKVNSEYLCAYTNSSIGKSQVLNLQGGMAQKHLNVGAYQVLKVKLPILDEQNKIVQILSSWDKAISTTEQLLANSQQQKKALMQQLLTGKKRFPGFSGEWETKTLGEIGEIKSAGVDKKILEEEEPVRLLNFTDVFKRGFIYSNDLNHWVTAPKSKVKSCDVKQGDVFFTPSSETRDDAGIPAVASEDIPDCCYSYHVVRFRINEKWNLNFKAYAFTTPQFRRQVNRLADGSGQRYVVSQDSFRSIAITYPKYEEQVLIGKVLRNTDDEIETLHQKLSLLKQEKKALMQQLLTGKKRVKVNHQEGGVI